ncbi:UNVERIFIED_CONTAM: hypothetical protein FKN15_074960 [Acipenser sinensis]
MWTWLPQHEAALEQIKHLVSNHPILKYYDVHEEVTLQCDASETGLGAALLQNGQPVAFASRTLTPTEQRYAQIEKECLAIVFACEKFDQYIHGRERINIQSDHKPLETIFKKPLLSAPKRLQRMMLRLQRYQLHVKYKKGKEMHIADFLSRAPLPLEKTMHAHTQECVYSIETKLQKEIENIDHATNLNFSTQSLNKVKTYTQQDASLQTLQSVITIGWPETKQETPTIIKEYWTYRDELTTQDGIIYKGNRVVIPKAVRSNILTLIHESHCGIEASLRKARDVVFWPNMTHEVKDLISKCSICNEHQRKQQKETLIPHQIPEQPWSKVGMDFFTVNKSDYLIIVDYYSDYWEIDELQDTTATTTIECCKRHFSRHGIPDTVITDNGPQFVGHEFEQFANEWEFRHTTSSPYHSQSNGKAESAVKIAKTLLKKAKQDGKDPWKAILNWRNTPTEGMKSSPIQRLMSRRTRTLLPTAQQLLKPKVVEDVTERKEIRQQKTKHYYNRQAKDMPELQEGQTIRALLTPNSKSNKWEPGICTKQISPRSYEVKVNGHTYRRNRKDIKPVNEQYKDIIQRYTDDLPDARPDELPTDNLPDGRDQLPTDNLPDARPDELPTDNLPDGRDQLPTATQTTEEDSHEQEQSSEKIPEQESIKLKCTRTRSNIKPPLKYSKDFET